MTKAEKNKQTILRKINDMRETEMTRSELKWLRGQMESQDADISKAAASVHDTKLFMLSGYAEIKNVGISQLEFYAQGEMSDTPSLAEDYRHVRYVLKAKGNMTKTLFDGDVDYTPSDGNNSVSKKPHGNIGDFFVMFLGKLDELFATIIYMPGSAEPGLPHSTDGRRDLRFAENTTARWSLRLTFENGAQRTAVQDGSYLSDAGLLLEAIDEYFESGSMTYLEPDRDWTEVSGDEVTDWQDLF